LIQLCQRVQLEELARQELLEEVQTLLENKPIHDRPVLLIQLSQKVQLEELARQELLEEVQVLLEDKPIHE